MENILFALAYLERWLGEIMENPKCIEQAVDFIVKNLSDEDVNFINNQSVSKIEVVIDGKFREIVDSSSIHMSYGRFLRNKWNLWGDCELKRDAIENYGIAHADDISGLILDWVFAKVKNQVFDPQVVCERFHKHWANFGMTSLQAGGIK